ncbi:MAG: redox-regulated ATPase YchF [Desulfobacteraceae bacterium]|nr:redox-regulated ATPase YchF [Desulfobacteraceae bacterium]MCB9494988.1 redox-regulated ATPase YchF [Desulfobacteraceae bacterium]
MMLNCGIVGLPNVGKSTIFSALTSAPAEAANYPFCTIEPNIGIVNLPDSRLDKIAEIFNPKSLVPASVEFVDIAGLVKGASKGEGLGNQFLGNIRQVGAILHVVRCFEDDDVTHVHGKVDPTDDIEVINTELALADLETVEKRVVNLPKMKKNQDKKISDKAKFIEPVLEKISAALEQGRPARSVELNEKEAEALKELHLITMKPVLYCCNVDESGLEEEPESVMKVRELAAKDNSEVVVISGKIEAEIASLGDEEERREFLKDMGLSESGLSKMIRAVFHLLGLSTYFTAGEKEVKAWTFKTGIKAPQAAGIIHSDFERGFIKAEIYSCDDLFELGTEAKIKEVGKMRIEGKDYVVKDGDVIHFRFNV